MKKRLGMSFALVGIMVAIFFVASSSIPNKIPGHVEYCEHSVSDDVGVRLAYVPYSTDPAINPNDWQGEPLSYEFMPFQIILIDSVDYAVTHDGGATWENFWHFNNIGNDFPWCDAFDSLDVNSFWLWTRDWIAITHDGGINWLIQDGLKEWNTGGNMVIDYVKFSTRMDGRIVFVNWPDVSDPSLLTNDGGKTWHPDPDWKSLNITATPKP